MPPVPSALHSILCTSQHNTCQYPLYARHTRRLAQIMCGRIRTRPRRGSILRGRWRRGGEQAPTAQAQPAALRLASRRCGVAVVLPCCPRFPDIAPRPAVRSALGTGSNARFQTMFRTLCTAMSGRRVHSEAPCRCPRARNPMAVNAIRRFLNRLI
jgi:hypothetical protein